MLRILTGCMILTALLVSWAPISQASNLEIRIVPCEELPETALQVVARPVDDSSERDPVAIELPAGQASGRMSLEGPQRWSVQVDTPGVWSEQHRVSRQSDEVVRLHLWSEARLAGKIEVPRNEVVPRELTIRLQPVRQVRQSSGGSFACAVEEIVARCQPESDGSFSCPLPAGRWNLRTKAEGWAPHFSWDFPLSSQGVQKIGSVPLRRGATVLGEVTTVDGPAAPQATAVELIPFRGTIPESDGGAGRRAHADRTELNTQGFFVFEDVSPGLYEIRAHQPGYSQARFGPLEVVAGRETRLLQPIVLLPPVRLLVQVEPARSPQGEPWTIEMVGEEEVELSSRAVKGQADAEGRWSSPEIDPGVYLIQVFDERGNRVAWRESVEVATVDAYLAVDLDFVRVTGRVSRGDDPVAAEVWFGGETGTERIATTSDDEGELEVVLPRAGTWKVDVVARDSGILFRGHEVTVAKDEELQIELPATEIGGEVLDQKGASVAGATVQLVLLGSDSGLVTVEADGDGRFTVRSLREGSYWIHAESGARSSPTILVELVEDAPPAPLQLVVEERRSYAGRVLSSHGGVAGAVVVGLPFSGAGPPGAPVESITGPDGRFLLSLPAEATDGQLVVLPPGFAPRVVRLRDGDPGEVLVSPAAGTVRVPGFSELSAGEVPLLLIDREPVDPGLFLRWAEMNGLQDDVSVVWRIPAMPAAVYDFCVVALDEAILIVTGRAHPTRCSRGILEPGGELTLAAP